MVAGFVHGVLNTDNINVTGESFDYGPWRFLPTLRSRVHRRLFRSDRALRLRPPAEPLIWNLTRLAECLLPLAPQADLENALAGLAPVFRQAYVEETLRRLGVESLGEEEDDGFLQLFWSFVHDSGAPFEQVVFDCYGGAARTAAREKSPCAPLYAGAGFGPLRAALDARPLRPGAHPDHLYFARPTPCTMLHPEVEAILAAVAADDWSLFEGKLKEIAVVAEAYGTGLRGQPAGPYRD